MDDSYYKERISAYADGALPPYEQRAVEEHLATCAECRALLDQIRKLTTLAEERSWLGESDYWESKAQKIEAHVGIGQTEVTQIKPARTWRGLGWKLATAAASIAVVGIIGYYSKDAIWEKSDRPVPMMQAPRVGAPSTGQPKIEKDLRLVPAETTLNAPVTKPMATGKLKSTQLRDTDNYKRPNDTKKEIGRTDLDLAAPQSVGTVAIPEEKGKSDSVQRVENLLKSVAGVKSSTDSGVYIRGGRAGEAEHAVDSGTRNPNEAAASGVAPVAIAPPVRVMNTLHSTSGQCNIEGKITDKATGQPIIGASIVLKGTKVGAMTDLDGNYRILRMEPGKYTLVITHVGHAKLEVTDVETHADFATQVNEALPTQQLAEKDITVRATRDVISKFDVNSLISKSNEKIKTTPVVKDDSLLRSIAGVKTHTAGEVVLRGPGADSVQSKRLDSTGQAVPAVRDLAYWRGVRDSLNVVLAGSQTYWDTTYRVKVDSVNKVVVVTTLRQPNATASGLVQKKGKVDSQLQLLEVYYRIARLSADSSEVASATAYLTSVATDSASACQKEAKAYLDSLSVK